MELLFNAPFGMLLKLAPEMLGLLDQLGAEAPPINTCVVVPAERKVVVSVAD